MSDCNKVYCVECAYFNSCRRSNTRISFDNSDVHDICNAPQNIRSTYLSDGSNKYISSPSIINKHNNCKWFSSKTKSNDALAFIDRHNKNPKSHPYLIEKFNEINNKLEESLIDLEVKISNNQHYNIKTIESTIETPNEYFVFDYSSNNINLNEKTGTIYIYLPSATTVLNGKAREFIVNVSNRSSGCIINFASKDGESLSFKDNGILETIKTQKEEFSLKFQEYNNSKFLVDQVGNG